jgi:hypothetical protein
MSRKYGRFEVSQPYGLHGLLQGYLYLSVKYCQIVTDKYFISLQKETNAIIKTHMKTLGKTLKHTSRFLTATINKHILLKSD